MQVSASPGVVLCNAQFLVESQRISSFVKSLFLFLWLNSCCPSNTAVFLQLFLFLPDVYI